MSRPSCPAALAIALLAIALRAAPSAAQDPFEIVPLADGVWAAIVTPDPPMSVFANALVVEGEDGVLVVDTHQSPSAAEWLIEAIRARTERPVRWIVNTHWHGDHVHGNAAYRDVFPGVEFIGHATLAEDVPGIATERLAEEIAGLPGSIADRERWLETGVGPDGEPLSDEDRAAVERSLAYRTRYLDEIEGLELVPPTRTVEDEWTLSLGSRRVRILHFGPAHTRGDVVVHLPDDGIVAVGDLLEEGIIWIDEGSDPAGWARALDGVDELGADVLVPAHGGILRDDAPLETTRGILSALARAARAAAEAGKDVEALRRDLDLGPWRERLTGGDPAMEAALDRALERWTAIALERERER